MFAQVLQEIGHFSPRERTKISRQDCSIRKFDLGNTGPETDYDLVVGFRLQRPNANVQVSRPRFPGEREERSTCMMYQIKKG